jgi:hypothetical protein
VRIQQRFHLGQQIEIGAARVAEECRAIGRRTIERRLE